MLQHLDSSAHASCLLRPPARPCVCSLPISSARPILSLVPHQGSPQGRAPREEGCKPRVKKVKDPNAADEDKPKCGRKRKEAPANGGSYSHALQYNGQWDHHGGGYPGYPPPPQWDDSSNGRRLGERLGGFAHACAARLIKLLCIRINL
ncbi:hypothetical protein C8R44DRAFT_894651 [Mycena epipterygia]|nr:hypothetical protein C8R44DRAFT_894651 [Mycena epipterygia]